jgi:hypothetical protein
MVLPAASNDQTEKWMLIPAEYQNETMKSELLHTVDHDQTCSTLPN